MDDDDGENTGGVAKLLQDGEAYKRVVFYELKLLRTNESIFIYPDCISLVYVLRIWLQVVM